MGSATIRKQIVSRTECVQCASSAVWASSAASPACGPCGRTDRLRGTSQDVSPAPPLTRMTTIAPILDGTGTSPPPVYAVRPEASRVGRGGRLLALGAGLACLAVLVMAACLTPDT